MKKLITVPFGMLYHLWYYVVMALVIAAISPFIYATSRKSEDYHKFFRWSRVWAKAVLFLMGLRVVVKGKEHVKKGQQYVIIANHTSELDIMMTLAIVPNPFVFIGKKELAKLPVFGYFYKRTNILVDRKSVSSKRRAMEMAEKRLKSGTGLCVFPEGGIPASPDLAPFKMGAFKLAIDSQVPILTVVYPDNRKHFPDFTKGGYPGRVRAVIAGSTPTEGLPVSETVALREESYRRIFDTLKQLA